MLMPEGFYFPHVTWPQIHACVIINIVLELIDWLILHLFINLHRYILLYYLASKHRMYLLIFIWRQRVRLIYTLIKSLTTQIINVGCIQTANPKRYNCIIKHPAYQIIDLGRKCYRTQGQSSSYSLVTLILRGAELSVKVQHINSFKQMKSIKQIKSQIHVILTLESAKVKVELSNVMEIAAQIRLLSQMVGL